MPVASRPQTLYMGLISSQGVRIAEIPVPAPLTYRTYEPVLRVEGEERRGRMRLWIRVDPSCYVEQELDTR